MNVEIDVASTIAVAAKWAFTTRRVARSEVRRLDRDVEAAGAGDLVLARVERIGSHKRLQLASGRPSQLYVGDLVVVACGARYAPDQFEGLATLSATGADLLASGGVAGQMRAANGRMSAPTQLAPLGLLCRADGQVVNLSGFSLPTHHYPSELTVIVGLGSSMNAGKTTAIAGLAQGLVRAGHRVAALKVTGTGAFGDYHAYLDAGAQYVADFVDAGMVSTYLEGAPRIVAGMETLLGHAAEAGCTVALVELADGVFQRETAALLRDEAVADAFHGVLFAAPDAAAAVGGCATLRAIGLEPDIVTGLVSRSPLAAAEAEGAADVEIVGLPTLCDPAYAGAFLAGIEHRRAEARAGRDLAA
ncbi:MAG: DUF1611 domain-containing protein [Pseudomonadota bacterium]